MQIYCKKDAAIPQINKYKWSDGSYEGCYKINFRAHKMKLAVKHKDHTKECEGDCLGITIISNNDSHVCLSMTPVHVALLSEIEIYNADGGMQVKLSGIEALPQIFSDYIFADHS